MISTTKSSGSGRLSKSVKLSSFSQKISRLVLSLQLKQRIVPCVILSNVETWPHLIHMTLKKISFSVQKASYSNYLRYAEKNVLTGNFRLRSIKPKIALPAPKSRFVPERVTVLLPSKTVRHYCLRWEKGLRQKPAVRNICSVCGLPNHSLDIWNTIWGIVISSWGHWKRSKGNSVWCVSDITSIRCIKWWL